MDRFTEKVALVSGAASGIGEAIADRLAAEGATVVGTDLDGDVVCDVTSMDSCRAAVATTLERHGRLDVLCNVAGIGIAHPITDFPVVAYAAAQKPRSRWPPRCRETWRSA